MVGMGILTYVKIALAAVVLGVCGYYVWNYHHMQTKITALEDKVASQQLSIEILDKARVATEAFIAKQSKVKRRVSIEQQQIDQTVNTGDDSSLSSFYDKYRMRPKGQGSNSGTGKSGSPIH